MSYDRQPHGAARFSNESQSERSIILREPTSSAMELSGLTLNFRALNLLDKTLNLMGKRSSNYAKPSPEAIANKKLGYSDKCENSLPIISLEEISWHDTIDDCWLVICDYVYNCTEFIKNHPGGQDVLLEYAGRDATLAFVGSGHSQGANRLLEKFLIGELPPSERIFRTVDGIKIGDCV
ncbi:cytochrome b5 type B [Nasonia vitripennis]|uniref:Cytochrome b5 heme-binding domain-containing protein n=1 Tax=Nasonia vitripennis TaxID=7425 RepID=A0A7M7G226_NASVI|nr:cytochrome b5 type B [Nasonia vitripennis]